MDMALHKAIIRVCIQTDTLHAHAPSKHCCIVPKSSYYMRYQRNNLVRWPCKETPKKEAERGACNLITALDTATLFYTCEVLTTYNSKILHSYSLCIVCCSINDRKNTWWDLSRGKHIKKQRHYLANKGPSSQGRLWFFQRSCMDVRVGLWRKLSARRIDAFELWCWRRLLRVPWTARRSNQSILKEISPGYSLEGLMLKLKL